MSSVVLAVILGVVAGQHVIYNTSPGRRISIIDVISRTQQAQESYNDLDNVQFALKAQAQYKSSGMGSNMSLDDNGESPLSQSTLTHIANECKSPSIHHRVEDHVFMALFESITTGCNQVQNIWDSIPLIQDEAHFNQLINNISYAIGNKTFDKSDHYGIPEDVIQNIAAWLEPDLNEYHPDLSYDISYHIYRWLLQRKYRDIDYFADKCDFINNDPVDIFTNIEATLSPVHDCITHEVINHNINIPKVNCSAVNRWHKTFVLSLEFNVQLSFILGVNAGVGIGVQLKTIALGEFYWKAGGGLSLFFGFDLGIDLPYVSDIRYLNGGTIKLGGGFQLVIAVGGYALFNNKFDFIGYEIDAGLGIAAPPIVIDLEYIERKSIKSFMVNLTAICASKTLRPSGHPTFRPDVHPTLRPNTHPTHKPIKVPTRDPNHPTPGPTHPTFRPPERKGDEQKPHVHEHGDKYGDEYNHRSHSHGGKHGAKHQDKGGHHSHNDGHSHSGQGGN